MIRHLVLCGLGPGHLRLLAHLAKQPRQAKADIGISLLTRQRRYISDAQLLKTITSPGAAAEALARQASAEAEELEALVQKSGARWIDSNPQALDAVAKTLLLDDGRTLRFDWLTIEAEPVQNRDQIDAALPGARANGLFVRPREAFCKLWPQVQALAATRPLRFAVVLNLNPNPPMGGSTDTATTTEALDSTQPMPMEPPAVHQPAAHWPLEKSALELAFALHHAFKGSAVTLITGGVPVGEGLAPALQACLASALKKRHITVLRDAARTLSPGEVVLQSSARLACDVPLLVLKPGLPPWLVRSGLALCNPGQIETDRTLRSTSHPAVFVSPQVAAADARRLFLGLRGVIAGRPPVATPTAAASAASANSGATATLAAANANPAKNQLQRIDCGDGFGIVAWRNWAMESRKL